MIVSTPRELLWAWLNARVGTPISDDFRAVGLVKDGCIQAVAGYNAWVGKTCCFHGAIDGRAAIDRTYLRAIFSYPFDQCGVIHMLALVSETNEASLRFCKKSGFYASTVLSGGGPEGEDLFLLRLRRDMCFWLKDRHGQKERTSGSRLHGCSREDGNGQRGPHEFADRSESSRHLHSLGQPDVVV